MPKEGFSTITVPDDLYNQIQKHVDQSGGDVNSSSSALKRAWGMYERSVNGEPEKYVVEIDGKKIGPNQPVYTITILYKLVLIK